MANLQAGSRALGLCGWRPARCSFFILFTSFNIAVGPPAPGGGSLFVEREVATQAVVDFVNHYTPLTSEQELGAVATVRDWLNARRKISLTALPMLLWGALKYLRTLIRTTNRVWE